MLAKCSYMKFHPNHAGSKDEKSPIKILLVFLIASMLIALLTVYLISLMLAGN
jgi:hypothetical protein